MTVSLPGTGVSITPAGPPVVSGDGFVVNNNGTLVGRTLTRAAAAMITNGNGVAGNPVIGTVPGELLMGQRSGVNLASTADQAITLTNAPPIYVVTSIIVTNASAIPVLAAGGFYTAAAKAGTALVGVGQLYTGLTSALQIVFPALTTAAQSVQTATTLYLSLSVANVLPCTADVYIYGKALS